MWPLMAASLQISSMVPMLPVQRLPVWCNRIIPPTPSYSEIVFSESSEQPSRYDFLISCHDYFLSCNILLTHVCVCVIVSWLRNYVPGRRGGSGTKLLLRCRRHGSQSNTAHWRIWFTFIHWWTRQFCGWQVGLRFRNWAKGRWVGHNLSRAICHLPVLPCSQYEC